MYVSIGIRGAVCVSFLGDVNIMNSTFVSNSVRGVIVGGAGIGVSMQSSATIDASTFSRNWVEGTGYCVSMSDVWKACPAAIGAGVANSGGNVNILNSVFVENIATCSNEFGTGCAAHGGALSSSGSGTFFLSLNFVLLSLSKLLFQGVLVVKSSSVSWNSVDCSKTGCVHGSGGCFYTDAGNTYLVNSTVFSNRVQGVGGGGAVSLAGISVLNAYGSIFSRNSASQGSSLFGAFSDRC